jgi:hypothetical protein
VLYKVTPMMAPPEKKTAKPKLDPDAPREPRKRRKSAVYDADGNEVLITMMCLKCRSMKPLLMFGLRKMADGAIRNQPWCRTCRSGASSKKKKDEVVETDADAQVEAEATPPPAVAAQVLNDPPMAEISVTPATTPPAQAAEPRSEETAMPLPEAAEPIAP